ncbi:hypothetical protein ACFFRR_005022 [Megaselia abdita]
MEEVYVVGEDPFNWTYTRTNIFLDLIINRLPKFRNPKILKLALWAEILEELNAHYPGNVLDVKKLKKKFDNMKKTFMKNKDMMDIEKALQWPYFRRMDEVMGYLNDRSDTIPNTGNVMMYEMEGSTEIYIDPQNMEESFDPEKGFLWNTVATNLLLEIMEDKLSSDIKIKSFWQVVTDTFLLEYQSEEPPDLDVKKVSKKFSNMKKTYLKNKKKLMDGIKVDWPYYKPVERIVENHDDSSVKEFGLSDDWILPDDYVEENGEEPEIEEVEEEVERPEEDKKQDSEVDWVEFEMLEEDDDGEEEEGPLEPQLEIVDLRCRVCYEAVTTFKTFAENIQTCSGQDVSIDSAFSFATKYDLENSKKENILCFSCTNSLKFVFEFLEKAEESKQKFDAKKGEKAKEKSLVIQTEKVVIEEEKDELKSYDFDEIIEEERDDSLSNSFDDIENVIEEKLEVPSSTATKKKAKYICGRCKRAFTSENMLHRHFKIVHRLTEYPCLVCQKSFTTANLLHRHTSQIHRPGRDFQCPKCKKAFQYRERLTAHMRIHSERTHVCSMCSKAYVTAKELTIHMRTHTNERPYKCEYCTESFSQKDRLTHHVKKKHLNIIYKCKYCSVFSSANHNTTRRHEMEHFKFAYECDLCPKKYSKRDRFVEHLKSSHNQSMTEEELKDMLIQNRNEAKRLEQEYYQNEAACEEGDIQMEVEVNQMDEDTNYIEYLVSED